MIRKLRPEDPKPRRKRGMLSPEDRAIWREVAKTAKPLPGRALPPAEAEAEPAPPKAEQAAPSRPAAPPAPARPALLPLAGVEKRLARDVSRGRRPIEARIDLHGLRQDEAHRELLAFVHRAYQSGAKLVLVITGKGGTGAGERGVLRRMVPHWLADPGLRPMVIGFDDAARMHGGEGALYVRIRRKPR